jgi:hypothetical protein
MPRSTEPHYTDSTWLTLGLVGTLAAFVVLSEFSIWATFLELDLLQQARTAGVVLESALEANDRRQALVGGLQLLAFVASAGLFLRWLPRMNRNARALSATGMEYGPIAAAAWFVAPVFQAWKPFDVLRELYQASSPDHIDDWRRAPVPHLLTLWWTLWLLFQGTLGVALLADLWARSVAQLYTAAWGGAVVGVVAAPLGVAAAIGAWRLHALQRRRFRCTAPLRVRHPWPTRATDEVETASS